AAVMASSRGQQYEFLRIADRQKLQNDLIDQAEDRGVGANAEGEGKHRDGSEQGRLAERAKGEAQILQYGCHAGLYCGSGEKLRKDGLLAFEQVQSRDRVHHLRHAGLVLPVQFDKKQERLTDLRLEPMDFGLKIALNTTQQVQVLSYGVD